eukprot:1189469-Prorocentrum_minimum.AAC.4
MARSRLQAADQWLSDLYRRPTNGRLISAGDQRADLVGGRHSSRASAALASVAGGGRSSSSPNSCCRPNPCRGDHGRGGRGGSEGSGQGGRGERTGGQIARSSSTMWPAQEKLANTENPAFSPDLVSTKEPQTSPRIQPAAEFAQDLMSTCRAVVSQTLIRLRR